MSDGVQLLRETTEEIICESERRPGRADSEEAAWAGGLEAGPAGRKGAAQRPAGSGAAVESGDRGSGPQARGAASHGRGVGRERGGQQRKGVWKDDKLERWVEMEAGHAASFGI